MLSLLRITLDKPQNVQSRPSHTFFHQLLDSKPALAPWFTFRVMFLEAFRYLLSKEIFQLNSINANANIPVVSNIAQ